MALLTVNGQPREVGLVADRTLLSALREELGLTGAKYGCGEGECGACTVLVDGAPARACVTPLAEVAGRSVTTVEGLARDGRLHPVQQAFLDERAMQCGYCTPGMVMAAVGLLRSDPDPDDDRIVEAMNGNICRCGAYGRILRAIRRAAQAAPPGPQDQADRVDADADSVQPASFPRPATPWDRASPDDRDFFDVLPPGLVVVLPPEALGDRAWTAGGGAWIHVGEGGTVTAFSGKVDVGQGNRTALAQIVAEEVQAPFGSVRVVMGDTDVCPWDMGTFGSRSMPDAGPILAAAAGGAREHLLRLAAERLEVDVGDLEAADGHVGVRGTTRRVSFGDLVAGRRDVHTVEGVPQPIPAGEWETAGRNIAHLNGHDVVTGERRYPTDVALPGMLHGRALRPPAHGATVRSVDLSGAEGAPGTAVVREGPFVGVAAEEPEAAGRALEAIRAEWDVAPQPDDASLDQHLRAHPVHQTGWGGEMNEENGDVDRALAQAAHVVQATYTTAYIQHVPLETRSAVATWEGQKLSVCTGTQRPFGVREELAAELGVPEEAIRVIVPATGGGFGGKHSGEAAAEAARLARATGRPVKVRWTRQEEFTWAYFRPAAVIDVRSGATADGRLTAWEFTNINSGAAGIGMPYDVANTRIHHQPADAPLPQGSYRALAATANAFARESHLDEVAQGVGLDPLEFRLRNLSDDRLAEVLRTAADHAGWARGSREGVGMGLAMGFEKDARVAAVATVRQVGAAGFEVERIVTAIDCGAIVNPDNLRNQVEGATVMALGGALFERVRFRDGRILNPSLKQYRVPRFRDVPPIEVVLIDRREEPSAGAGETPMIAVAPAIANALFAATGQRIRSMPLLA